jgi:formylglycine-generating enzyme required for sulfatase activity
VLSDTLGHAVYCVCDTVNQQEFALKVAKTPLAELSLCHEISVLEHMQDIRCCMRVVKSDQSESHVYYLMPYLGNPLSHTIVENPYGKRIGDIATNMAKLSRCVVDIHNAKCIHGDIHPDNIYTTEQNDYVFGDFSYAVCAQSPAIKLGAIERQRSGPAGFISPQLLLGNEPDVSDDVFSLTAVFTAMLSATSDVEKMQKWQQDNRSDAFSEIFQILDKGMHTDPQKRFVNAQALADAFDALAQSSCASLQIPSTDIADDQVHPPIETEPELGKIKLNQSTQALYQTLEEALRLDGYLSDEQAQLCQSKYLNDLTTQDAEKVYRSLLEQVKGELILQGLAAWFDWTLRMLTILKHCDYQVSDAEAKRLVTEGVDSGAGDAFSLSQWMTRQRRKGASRTRSARWLSIPVVIVLAVVVYLFQSESDNTSTQGVTDLSLDKTPVDTSPPQRSFETLGILPEQAKTLAQPNVQSELTQPQATITTSEPSSVQTRYEIVDDTNNDIHRFDMVEVNAGDATFFVMSQEVTQGLWQSCVNASKCRSARIITTDPHRKRLNDAQHPVVNISWYDITEDFIPYINAKTSETFSLPTMAQWISFGFTVDGEPNIPKILHCADCQSPLQQTYSRISAPVDSLMANANGLYHVYGNAQEWLQDCWQDVKLQLQRCDQAPAVGGSFLDDRALIESRPLNRLLRTARSTTTGFRLIKREDIQP